MIVNILIGSTRLKNMDGCIYNINTLTYVLRIIPKIFFNLQVLWPAGWAGPLGAPTAWCSIQLLHYSRGMMLESNNIYYL